MSKLTDYTNEILNDFWKNFTKSSYQHWKETDGSFGLGIESKTDGKTLTFYIDVPGIK